MIDKAMLGGGPQVQRDQNYENARNPGAKTSDVNFDQLMMDTSAEIASKREQEKSMNGGKEVRIGESKSDVEFREQLEKMSGKRQGPRKGQLDKDDFLTLMVTQLKHQDPTKPQETNEMATQLAQFNSVEQLVHMNKAIGDLVKSQNELRSDRLTQYIGMDVQVASDKLKIKDDGKMSDAYFELPIPSGSTSVAIKDSNSKVIRYLTLGASESGTQRVKWDGLDDKGQKASPGQYTFVVSAATNDGKPIQAKTTITSRVNAITSIHEGGKLDTDAGPMEPKNIIAIRAPNQNLETVKEKQSTATNPERKEPKV
jgi:flagellar basal-body rod modification protein FlgD